MGKWVRLGEVCDILNGFAFKSENYVSSGIRIIRITNVQDGEIIDDDPKFYPSESKEEYSKYELYENDLLISLTGNVGRVGLINSNLLPAALNQRVGCIRIKDNIPLEKNFLFRYLHNDNFISQCFINSKGIAQKNMSTEWLKEYPIPLLPVETQKKIADVLDKASELIEKRKAQIAKLDELTESIFIDMFGDPKDNSHNFPVANLCELCSVGSSKRIYQSEQTKKGVPFLRISDLVQRIGGEKQTAELYISETKYEELKKNGLTPTQGDILVTSRGTIGACYIVKAEDDFYFQDGMISWLYNMSDRITSTYIYYLFKMQGFRRQIDEVPTGSTVNYLSIARLRELKIMCPDIMGQYKFAAFVKQVEKSKFDINQSLEKLGLNYKSLMQKCFSGEI